MTEFFISHCYSVFQQSFDVPVKGYTSFLRACLQENKLNLAFFSQHVFPQIQAKSQFLDKEGCLDTLEALNSLGQTDIPLFEKVKTLYESKQDSSDFCTLDSWNCDVYTPAVPVKDTTDLYL
jgi:hypothetical protein